MTNCSVTGLIFAYGQVTSHLRSLVEADIPALTVAVRAVQVCKYTGWIEVLGAGMVHPNVLEMAGVDSEVYGGFAFGVGPDRFAMLKYGVDDIRNFYLNDVRFLTQFSKKG